MNPVRDRETAPTLPLVVVAGRPNVGKSTLVNRIVGRRAAVVEERPGVTRDRKELEAEWRGRRFTVVDTGGWLSSDDPLDAQVSAQAERAIAEADVILFVIDVTVGPTDEDLAVARLLKRSGRTVRVVVNKVDSDRGTPTSGTHCRSGSEIPGRSARSTAGAPAISSTTWSTGSPSPSPGPTSPPRAPRRRVPWISWPPAPR